MWVKGADWAAALSTFYFKRSSELNTHSHTKWAQTPPNCGSTTLTVRITHYHSCGKLCKRLVRVCILVSDWDLFFAFRALTQIIWPRENTLFNKTVCVFVNITLCINAAADTCLLARLLARGATSYVIKEHSRPEEQFAPSAAHTAAHFASPPASSAEFRQKSFSFPPKC